MAKLILSMDGLVLKEIPLQKERTTIGRKAHNDIQIDNLSISGEHAAIVCILNDAFLEDLNSTNGTYVNGQPVKKQVLKDSDVVELGKYRLKFLKDAPDATLGANFEKAFTSDVKIASGFSGQTDTIVGFGPSSAMGNAISSTANSTTGWRTTESGEMAEGSDTLGMIQILSGRNAGRELDLSKSLTTLGKPGVQVAVITRRPRGYYITHVEGATFPMVNGRQIDAQTHALTDHDVIEIAGVKMEFYLKPMV